MPISVAQIDHWRAIPHEVEGVEFKEAKNQFDNAKLFRYCVGIANAGGGVLILGVSNKLPRRIVSTSAFENPGGIAQKIYSKLRFRVNVEEVNHPDGRIVVFEIPPRPPGRAYEYEGAFLMRCGEELLPMTSDELRAIHMKGEPEWLEQHLASGLSEIDVCELLDTQTYFKLIECPYPTSEEEVLARLASDHLVDATGPGTFSLRRMAGLLLSRDLTRFPELGRKGPRVIVYQGTSRLDTPIRDVEGKHGYAVGFQNFVRFVSNSLPANEIVRDALRTRVRLIPEHAVRELLANALVHQDFSMRGSSVTVEIFSNRLEISNPGEPIVPVERFIDGYQSRNERLAHLMRRMRICEERGRGLDEVVRQAELAQLPAPEFRAIEGRTQVLIHGPRSFDDTNREDRLRACFQHCVLKYVNSEPMTNQSLRERFNVPERKSYLITQVIQTAVEERIIKPDEKVGNSRKLARYVPFWA